MPANSQTANHNQSSEKPIVVYTAIAANLLITLAKFAAAIFSGSSGMLSEGIHSLVDTGNQVLMLLGVRLSRRPADEDHPFGHGQELYFWGLVVAMVLFGLGGGMSIYEGITRLQHPADLGAGWWTYAVLAVAAVLDGISLTVALRALLANNAGQGFWQALHRSKDPSKFVAVMEDSADLVGLALAAVGVGLSQRLNDPRYDGYASLLIGVILAAVAVFLAEQTRSLLLGERAERPMLDGIRDVLQKNPAVTRVRQMQTMHFGPDTVLLTVTLDFKPGLSSQDLVAQVNSLEHAIQSQYPVVKHIFIEVASIATLAQRPPDGAVPAVRAASKN